MPDSLRHLRKMKRRQAMVQSKPTADVSTWDKVDMLEKTLSVFRKEVEMKLKIMQQILTTRNEQATVQKKLLEQEQILYDTLLGHWKNTPKLAATGLSVNFSSADILEDFEDVENQSDPDYEEGDEAIPGPSRKKSKSSLRKLRKSAKTTHMQNVTVNPGLTENDDGTIEIETDPFPTGTPNSEWDGEDEPRGPPVHVQMKTEGDEDDDNDFDEFSSGGELGQDFEYDPVLPPPERKTSPNPNISVKSKKTTKQKDTIWDEFDCTQKDPKTRKFINTKCKRCGSSFKWPKVERLRNHVYQCTLKPSPIQVSNHL